VEFAAFLGGDFFFALGTSKTPVFLPVFGLAIKSGSIQEQLRIASETLRIAQDRTGSGQDSLVYAPGTKRGARSLKLEAQASRAATQGNGLEPRITRITRMPPQQPRKSHGCNTEAIRVPSVAACSFHFSFLILYLYCSYHQLTMPSIYTMRAEVCEKTRNLSRGAENRA
jgi:hypothetical protein